VLNRRTASAAKQKVMRSRNVMPICFVIFVIVQITYG
jgi:hypothetical protein